MLGGLFQLTMPEGWVYKPENGTLFTIEVESPTRNPDTWGYCTVLRMSVLNLANRTQMQVNDAIRMRSESNIRDLEADGIPYTEEYVDLGAGLRSHQVTFVESEEETHYLLQVVDIVIGAMGHSFFMTCYTAIPPTEKNLADI